MRGDLAAVTWNYNGIIVMWNYNNPQNPCNGPYVQIEEEFKVFERRHFAFEWLARCKMHVHCKTEAVECVMVRSAL